MIAYEYKLMGADSEQQSAAIEVPDFEPRFKALEERLEALEKTNSNNTNNNGNGKKGG